MLSAKESMILDVLEPRAASEGVEIVTVEIIGAKRSPTIRVYIDAPDGVSFDVLASCQSWIGEIIEAVDPFPGAYTLEVSSPGIDRVLRTPDHFRRFIGSTAKIKTLSPHKGSSDFTGVITDAADDEVSLDVQGENIAIPFDDIKRANLIGTIDFSKRKE